MSIFAIKSTVMQIEKTLINDCLIIQNHPEIFTFQLFTNLQ